ncbi:MAG TPA: hypothetical protein VM680_10530 [Verrucomicrobiae bacterium]|nr:hypothetical protein [Verrucomicrobiae bacterium]
MKIIDWVIAAAIVGCVVVGYSGHRFVGLLLLIVVFILASWRFFDDRHLRGQETGVSADLNPELNEPSSTYEHLSGSDVEGDAE